MGYKYVKNTAASIFLAYFLTFCWICDQKRCGLSYIEMSVEGSGQGLTELEATPQQKLWNSKSKRGEYVAETVGKQA